MQYRRSSGVQGLVFGGIMAGLVVVFALVPFLAILVPIPLVLAYVRYGGRTAVMTSVVAALLAVLIKGPLEAFLITVPAGILPGLAFGYGFRHKMKPIMIGVLAVSVFLVGYAADYAVTRVAVLGGRDPIEDLMRQESVTKLFDTVGKTAEQTLDQQMAQRPPKNDTEKAAYEKQRTQIREMSENPVGFMWALLPVSVILAGAVISWINYKLCEAVLPRFGHPVPAPTPFREFRLPTWMVWVYGLAALGSGYVGGSLLNAPWWAKLIVNVVMALQYVFLLNGMAVAYGWLRIKRNLSKGMAILLSLAPLLLGALGMQVYLMLAMWDAIFDFRGLGHGIWKRPEPNP